MCKTSKQRQKKREEQEKSSLTWQENEPRRTDIVLFTKQVKEILHPKLYDIYIQYTHNNYVDKYNNKIFKINQLL
jgi:hypothetical protein